MPWDGVGGIIAVNTVLSSADAWLNSARITAAGNLVVDAEHVAQIDASATSRIEAWDAKSLVVAFNSIGWAPQNIFFVAADALASASDYLYDVTSNDTRRRSSRGRASASTAARTRARSSSTTAPRSRAARPST